MSINQIIKGTYNNLMSKEEEMSIARSSICHMCKLLSVHRIFGEVCNSKLYLNVITDETSLQAKPGFKRGCGCNINSKTRVKEAHCPLGKW